MIDKIKALPERMAFVIGLSLTLLSPIVLYLLPIDDWTTMLMQAMIWGVAILFIVSAADKRHSRISNNK